MSRMYVGVLIVLLLSSSLVVPGTMAQLETSPQTIKGDLLSIKQGGRVCRERYVRKARASSRR